MKLLIVDDQISNQFWIVEQLKICGLFSNNDIGIANNGLEAIFVAEKNNLEFVLMDIHMPVMDGITATKKITSKYPRVKVITITSLDNEMLAKESADAGAKGYLLKENISMNLASVIQNISDGNSVFPVNRKNVIKSNLNSYNKLYNDKCDKLSKVNKIIVSIIIENWIYRTKQYLLNKEKYQSFFNIDLNNRHNAVDNLLKGYSDQCTLIKELELRYEQLVRQRVYNSEINTVNLENKIKTLIYKLNYWFDNEQTGSEFIGLRPRLEANAQVLRINCERNIKEYIDSIIPQTSPIPCLEHLESIETLLNAVIEKYNSELSQFIEQEISACKSYNTLTNIFYQSKDIQSQRETATSIVRAILHVYCIRLKIDAYSLLIDTFDKTIRVLEFGIDDLILALNLLTTIKNQLNVTNIDENISSFVQKKLDTLVNYSELLTSIEIEVGYPINQWGVRGCINSSLILDKLSDRIPNLGNSILDSIEQELSN